MAFTNYLHVLLYSFLKEDTYLYVSEEGTSDKIILRSSSKFYPYSISSGNNSTDSSSGNLIFVKLCQLKAYKLSPLPLI